MSIEASRNEETDMDAIELLTTTKGVRRRIDFDRPVPYETLEECVEIAVKAPLGPGPIEHQVSESGGLQNIRRIQPCA